MNILFVYRGYGENQSNSVIDFQLYSLENSGIDIYKHPIPGGGLAGYFKAWKQLKKSIKKNKIDLVHAHYSFSGFIAVLASRKPVICSLMGSDLLQQKFWGKLTVKIFTRFFWNAVIVKSKEMMVKLPGSICIPNGVDMDNFDEIDKEVAIKKTGFDPACKNIIFVALQPQSFIKNLKLAQQAIDILKDYNIKLHKISNIDFKDLPYYYNAANLLLLTSLTEGSPNVVKEALACNCPVVSTDVGDVRELIGDIQGCHLSSFEPEDVAAKIKLALEYKGKINAREKIKHLDNKIIAERIVKLYHDIV